MPRAALSVLVALALGTMGATGCGGDDGSGENAGTDADQAARFKSEVVSGKFAPAGCESRDITRFLSSPEQIESQDKRNKQSAKAGAPGHEVVTDDTGQIGVNTYKVSAECKQAIEQALSVP